MLNILLQCEGAGAPKEFASGVNLRRHPAELVSTLRVRCRRNLTLVFGNKQKDRQKGGLCFLDVRMDQAASVTILRRRYVIAPMPEKPKIIIAQVLGSGTAAVNSVPVTTTLSMQYG
jgi:hypothetical protein